MDMEGLTDVMNKLDHTSADKAMVKAIDYGLDLSIEELKEYPQETSANRPNSDGRWYKRGTGSMYRRKDGSISVTNVSENLKDRWKKKISKSGVTGRLINDASYATWVQGKRQSSVMKRIGWDTTNTVYERISDKVKAKVITSFLAEWRKK